MEGAFMRSLQAWRDRTIRAARTAGHCRYRVNRL